MIKSDGMLDVMFEETGALTFALLGNRAIDHTRADSTEAHLNIRFYCPNWQVLSIPTQG
jgi:hypothetical protein